MVRAASHDPTACKVMLLLLRFRGPEPEKYLALVQPTTENSMQRFS
jgi:hypothetical protein